MGFIANLKFLRLFVLLVSSRGTSSARKDTKKRIKSIGQLRVLKFSDVLQNALYLTGYDQSTINIPNTNRLNWKFVRNMAQSLISRIQRRIERLMQEINEVD